MKKKILVVDDEPDILQVISFRLDKAGYAVTGAPQGEEALRMAAQDQPDLILLDVMMPGLDGFEVCRRIKEKFPGQKIIIYTAKVDGVNAGKARASGADDFTVKTADLKHILDAIRKLIPD